MRVSRVLTMMIGVLLVVSVCVAAEDARYTEALPEICPDLSDLNPSEHQRIPVPYYCQIIDDDGPVPQSNESVSSSAGLSRIGVRILDWLSSLSFLVPMIGA